MAAFAGSAFFDTQGVGQLAIAILKIPAASLAGALGQFRATEAPSLIDDLLGAAISHLATDALVQGVITAATIAPFVARIASLERLVARWTDGPPPFLQKQPRRRGHRHDPDAGSGAAEVLAGFADDPRARVVFGVFGSDREANDAVAQRWLETLSKNGWHCGVRAADIPPDWTPVRHTAIYIDQHFYTGDALRDEILRLGGLVRRTGGRKLRVLLSSRVDLPTASYSRDSATMRALLPYVYKVPAVGSGKQVPDVGAVIGQQKPGVDPERREDLYASLEMLKGSRRPENTFFLKVPGERDGAEYDGIVSQAATMFGPDGLRLIALAALAGPAPARLRMLLAPDAGDLQALSAIFPSIAQEDLQHMVPGVPAEYRMELLIQSLDRLQEVDRKAFATALMRERPETAEDLGAAISDWLMRQTRITESTIRASALQAVKKQRKTWLKPRRRHAEVSTAASLDVFGADDLLPALRSLQLASTAQAAMLQRWYGDTLGVILDAAAEKTFPLSLGDHLREVARTGVQHGDKGRQLGRLLEPLILAAAEIKPPEPAKTARRMLQALAPTILRRHSDVDKGELIDLISQGCESPGEREDYALLASTPAWRGHPQAVAAVLDLLLDHVIKDHATDFAYGPLAIAVPDFEPPAAKAAERVDADDPLRPALLAFDLMNEAFAASISDGEVWRCRLEQEADLLNGLLDGADPVGQVAAAWAVFWIVRPSHYGEGLSPLPATVVDRMLALLERQDTPPSLWRRLALVSMKLGVGATSRETITDWAEAADKGEATGRKPFDRRLEHSRIAGGLNEARRRLHDVGLPAERMAAGLLLLTFGENDDLAAEIVANGVRNPALDDRKVELYVMALFQAGRSASRASLKRMVLEGRGRPRMMAFLALFALGAIDELIEIGEAPILLEDPYRRALDRLLQWRPGPRGDTTDGSLTPWAENGFADILRLEETVCVLLVRGKDPADEKIFAYVGVRADRLEDFMAAQEKGLFYPEEFGVVIEHGYGEPDAEVRAKMERDYGFDHEGMLDIPSAEQARDVGRELSRKAAQTTAAKSNDAAA